MRRRLAIALAVSWGLSVAPASAQVPFSVGSITAAPGTVASGDLVVAPRAGDAGATIPISIVHGVGPGPVLALIAGMHGYEYPPILALQRFRASARAQEITGTLLLVHVANMPSFLGRTIYYSPVDGKNLNRVFPGRADGTVSERIADVITRQIVAPATHVVDLHCGDGNESLRPYSYWITTGPGDTPAVGRQMALAFGLDHIVIDTERPTDAANAMYLSNTAILNGKPALTIESGAMGQTDEESIARIERGIAGLMKSLGMTTAGPDPVQHPWWIGRNEVLRAGATGLLYPQVERGQTVARGALVAYITDFAGVRLEEIRAPFDGEVLYVLGTPPITKGEPVGFIGAHAEAPRE